jgi:hypothetical protein
MVFAKFATNFKRQDLSSMANFLSEIKGFFLAIRTSKGDERQFPQILTMKEKTYVTIFPVFESIPRQGRAARERTA